MGTVFDDLSQHDTIRVIVLRLCKNMCVIPGVHSTKIDSVYRPHAYMLQWATPSYGRGCGRLIPLQYVVENGNDTYENGDDPRKTIRREKHVTGSNTSLPDTKMETIREKRPAEKNK